MTVTTNGLSADRSDLTICIRRRSPIPSEHVGLVGAPGSGKSTLGHVLTASLRVAGRSVAHAPQCQAQELHPLRSMALDRRRKLERARGLPPGVERRRGLLRTLSRESGNLSKRPWVRGRGREQRFVIAMVLIGAPNLLVTDQPASVLDLMVAGRTTALPDRTLSMRGTAVLLINHVLGLAAQRLWRLMVMESGRIVEDTPTAQLRAAPAAVTAAFLCAHLNWLALPC